MYKISPLATHPRHRIKISKFLFNPLDNPDGWCYHTVHNGSCGKHCICLDVTLLTTDFKQRFRLLTITILRCLRGFFIFICFYNALATRKLENPKIRVGNL